MILPARVGRGSSPGLAEKAGNRQAWPTLDAPTAPKQEPARPQTGQAARLHRRLITARPRRFAGTIKKRRLRRTGELTVLSPDLLGEGGALTHDFLLRDPDSAGSEDTPAHHFESGSQKVKHAILPKPILSTLVVRFLNRARKKTNSPSRQNRTCPAFSTLECRESGVRWILPVGGIGLIGDIAKSFDRLWKMQDPGFYILIKAILALCAACVVPDSGRGAASWQRLARLAMKLCLFLNEKLFRTEIGEQK